MGLGDAAVLGVTQGADQGDDIKAYLMLGQGEAALTLRAVRAEMAAATPVMTAADRQVQAQATGQGDEGAVVGVVQPHALAAGGAILPLGRQILGDRGLGPARRLGHRSALLGWAQ